MRTGNCYQEGWSFPEGGARLFQFGLRSFRYAELVGYPGKLIPRSIAALALNSPFDDGDSAFDCSDPRLGQVCSSAKTQSSIRRSTFIRIVRAVNAWLTRRMPTSIC